MNSIGNGLALAALALLAAGPAQSQAKVPRYDAKNARLVDGFSAAKKPRPGQLLALDDSGRFPISALPLQELLARMPADTGPAGPPARRAAAAKRARRVLQAPRTRPGRAWPWTGSRSRWTRRSRSGA